MGPKSPGKRSRGTKTLHGITRLHKWEDQRQGESRVKVHALRVEILHKCKHVGKTLGDLNPTHRYGVHVLRIESLEHNPHNVFVTERPGRKSKLNCGDHLYVLIDTDEVDVLASSNEDLLRRLSGYFQFVGERTAKRVRLTQNDVDQHAKFQCFVDEFCLETLQSEDKLTCEQFDCFEVEYPNRAPPGWVGSPACAWASGIPIEAIEPEIEDDLKKDLRALNMRYTFQHSPVMILRKDERHGRRVYIVPARGHTVVKGGDKLIFLYDGLPWDQKREVESMLWWTKYVEKLVSEDELEKLPHVFPLRSTSVLRTFLHVHKNSEEPATLRRVKSAPDFVEASSEGVASEM